MSQTLTFEQLEKILKKKGTCTPEELTAHLRVQEMRLTAWEENLKKLNQRFTSLDEEFYEHVEVKHEGMTEVTQASNPNQFTPEYMKEQGFEPVAKRQDPNYFDHSEMEITDVNFCDPKQNKAFKTSLNLLQTIEPNITEGELVKFLMG